MQANVPTEPMFETHNQRTSFLVRLALQSTPAEAEKAITPQVASNVTPFSDKVLRELALALDIATTQVTTQVGKLLSAGGSGPRSREELQSAAGMANREHFRKFYIKPLVAAGWLERTIPRKPTSRMQKYRLTAKGRAWLAMI